MLKFTFLLWLQWSYYITRFSLSFALFISLLISLVTYLNKGAPTLNSAVYEALLNIFLFWFPFVWSIALLVSLFRSLKYIFNTPIANYKLILLECDLEESIEDIGYGDLVKVWRKWFLVIIWFVGIEMLLSVFILSLFTHYNSIFEWFNIYVLFMYLLIAGYFALVLLTGRCKRVSLRRC